MALQVGSFRSLRPVSQGSPRPLSRPTLLHVAGGAQHGETAQQHQPDTLPGQKALAEPPRPPELLGLGHMLPMGAHLLAGGNFEGLMFKWRQQYGPFFEFQVPFSPPVVVVADPEAIKQVYEVMQCPKSPRYMDLLPLLGPRSMVLTEGQEWKAQRDAFNPGFSSSFLRSALPGFASCTQHLVQYLDQQAEQQQVVFMHHVAILTTLEVICKVGFGEDVDFLLSDRSAGLWNTFEAAGRHVAFFLDNVPINWMKDLPWNRSKTQRLQFEYDRQLLPILLKRLGDMGIHVSTEEAQQLLQRQQQQPGADSGSSSKCPFPHNSSSASSSHASSNHVSISSNGACPLHADAAAGAGPAIDIQSSAATAPGSAAVAAASAEWLMLDSKDILTLAVKLSQQQGAADGSGLDLVMLMSQMKTFFAAGHDTTASLIGWTMYFLQQHPEVEAKLVDEVLRVMGPDTQPSYEQLTEMRYLNAVLKESLRFRPPVGLLARWGGEGSSLAGFNTSNKVLLVSPYVQHMDVSTWGPDADQWNPDRWLDPQGRAQTVSHYSYMPFSRGPRDCIGSKFALLEAKTILSMIYRQFEFEYAGDKPEEVLMSVTAHPKYGVPLRVKRRQVVAPSVQKAAAVCSAS